MHMRKERFDKNRPRFAASLLLIIALLLIGTYVSVTMGSVNVSPTEVVRIIANRAARRELFAPSWEATNETIIWNVRFPRVLLAFIVGAGLSLCGVLMQAFTKNPMADAYVLGISSGASAGAVCAIVLGWFSFMGSYATIFGATLGAILAIVVALSFASTKGRITSTQLVLAGMATSALFGAVTNLIVYGYHTGSDKTKTALFWMVGSLGGANWDKLRYVALVFAGCALFVLVFAKDLDVLLLGDDVAETLGVDTRRIKWVIIAVSTVLTGVVVSVSGVIGFVGLVVPHIVRSLVGASHKRLVPLAILGGGLFTMLTDLLSRVLIAPEELPIGVVSAFIGAPFFLYLIRRSNGKRR